MPALIVAFSGAIGTGKSNVSRKVQEILGWPRVSFGDYVRKQAHELGQDQNDRVVLQRLGQALVQRNTREFAKNVLDQITGWETGPGILVDGLRHVEVRQALIDIVGVPNFRLVFLSLDEASRRRRAEASRQIPPSQLIRYDQDITEAQISRILPAYADVKLDAALPERVLADDIISKLSLPVRHQAAE